MRSAKATGGMERASITVPKPLLAAAKAAAKQSNRSFSGFIQDALLEKLQRADKKRRVA
jgi:metal-responsive CopG/Arc/MetJ family transcriptional regulator